MKKLLTALLALMLACGVPALAEDAAATEATAVPEATAEVAAEAESIAFTPVGTWYLTSFEVTGATFAAMDMVATLTFNEDGTGALVGLNDMTFTWNYDGAALTATPDGAESPLTFSITETNGLTVTIVTIDSMTMTFASHAPEAQPLPSVALASLDGTWTRQLSIDGADAPADSIAMQFTCTIENGAVTVDANGSVLSAQGALEGNALVVAYEDGTSDSIYLYDDGTIHLFRTAAGGATAEYTLVRAEAAAAPEATEAPAAEAGETPTEEAAE